jgi:hypothetical protein
MDVVIKWRKIATFLIIAPVERRWHRYFPEEPKKAKTVTGMIPNPNLSSVRLKRLKGPKKSSAILTDPIGERRTGDV